MKRLSGRLLLLVYLVFFTLTLQSQSVLPPIEGWRIHASFANNNDLCEANDQIFVGSANGMFSYGEGSNEVALISKASGLSDVNITQIDYDRGAATLIVTYDNCNIDLIRNNKITNIPDLKNQLIIGEKKIYNISLYNGRAYLSGSFGVAVVDLQKQKLTDSYTNLGTNGSNLIVYDMAVYQDTIFLAAKDRIITAPFNSRNLSDYHSWKTNTTSSFTNHLEIFNNALYGVVDSTLKIYGGNGWTSVASIPSTTIYDLKSANNHLVVCTRLNTFVLKNDNTTIPVQVISENGGLVGSDLKLYCPVSGQYLVKIDLTTNAYEYFGPHGPQGNTATRMAYDNKNLWVSGGSVIGYATSSGWNSPAYSPNKFYRFNQNEWINYNNSNNPVVNCPGDFIDVTVNPENHHAFLANFGCGLLEMDAENVIAVYDTSNSSLQKFNSGIASYRPLQVSGLAMDAENNLWVSNLGAVQPFSVRTPDNKWTAFGVPSGVDNRLGHLTCDDYGSKWIINTRNQGILVFNHNGTLTGKSDDLYKSLNENKQNGFLPSNTVFCITKDKNGALWTGTLKGLCIFNNPENVFRADADFDAQQIVIKTGLIYSNFLGDVPVYCIAVDPGNRKWIGTAQGVWLVSPDGYTVIRNFTSANSPLLANAVYSIGIDESTGEVFFGTDKGICSYMGTASESTKEQNEVLVYPNPVKPDYTGLIAIRGLTADAFVKITDISGNLIYETRANGGMASWNGISFTGNRAPSGVYLIYSSDEEGNSVWVGKFVIIN